ncbi:ficolin-1-like [Dreissena polymorpha]|uniref:ficolin-1-like n=1 Tax=Dreissena polymorpha TaxID=45954 RepID=UPI00226482BF|nr:ficolin-1-like [Dreissena polymorpha]
MMTMARICDFCFLLILSVAVSANKTYNPEQQTPLGSLWTFTDCTDILRQGFIANGVYTIKPSTLWRPLQVYCDQTTAGGGWTVIQRRQDGSENFTRSWIDYAYGFGSLKGEFWLGNEFIHRLTSTVPNELRIELQDFENDYRVAKYGRFVVGPESDLYRSTIAFFSGNVTDSFAPGHNNRQFSTVDNGPSRTCAESYKGGFWYNNCHAVNINGLYLKGKHDSFADGVDWLGFRGYHYSLKFTEMKIRPY